MLFEPVDGFSTQVRSLLSGIHMYIRFSFEEYDKNSELAW